MWRRVKEHAFEQWVMNLGWTLARTLLNDTSQIVRDAGVITVLRASSRRKDRQVKFLSSLALAATTLVALPVQAVVVDWNTSSGGVGSTCASNALANCMYTFSSGGTDLKVRAYSAGTAQTMVAAGEHATSTRASNASRNQGWIEAQIGVYSGGLGVGNVLAGDSNDCTSGCSPEHALDNQEAWDVVVYELPASSWTITKLGIGWREGSSGWDTSPTDVDVWIGSNDAVTRATAGDFRDVCLNGTCSSNAGNTLAALGYTKVSLTFSSTGSQTVNMGAGVTGKYVVVAAGAYDSKKEAFKLSSFQATGPDNPPGGGGQVPEPGSLLLLMAGVMGLAHIRRRSAT